jgi:hypothetical protein
MRVRYKQTQLLTIFLCDLCGKKGLINRKARKGFGKNRKGKMQGS